ncbi:hypothetical protein GIB67_022521 [Kingdonia uniflora]|uniref:Uncharacterized protein n=1 Tax=Kingdonia uniflora TaxID=39325 RepID=A0A7J7L783_9MAGN|nr:hypothetical protein GIB67_022521 [Kingdonia uniflora]
MTFLEETQKSCRTVEDEDLNYNSDADEVLSLCNLPLGDDWEDLSDSKEDDHLQSRDDELFEFFNDLNHNMFAAEDIVFCGKLLPYKLSPLDYHLNNDSTRKSISHRKSDSLSDIQRSQSSTKGQYRRNSYSLDYREMQRAPSVKMSRTTSPRRNDWIPISKYTSKNNSDSKVSVSSSPAKSRWPLFMFRLIKPSPQIELRNTRNRQRSPSSTFSESDGENTVSAKRKEGKGYWKLLRALSCTGQANMVLTASSLGCMPEV